MRIPFKFLNLISLKYSVFPSQDTNDLTTSFNLDVINLEKELTTFQIRKSKSIE